MPSVAIESVTATTGPCVTSLLNGTIWYAATSSPKTGYVRFTEAELETLETEASKTIDLKEFVPLSKIDPVYFKSSHYLGADQGGEKPYRLLADAMAKTGRTALAELVTRGNELIAHAFDQIGA
jgi:non-homologous end joining protein Ku